MPEYFSRAGRDGLFSTADSGSSSTHVGLVGTAAGQVTCCDITDGASSRGVAPNSVGRNCISKKEKKNERRERDNTYIKRV